MTSNDAAHETLTRRTYMTYGGAVVGGGLLAGCTGDGAGDSPESGDTTDETILDAVDGEVPRERLRSAEPVEDAG